MPSIFISYRRNDTLDGARLLCAELTEALGPEAVIFDEKSIPAGQDFREYITSALRNCDILVALIGAHWLDAELEGKRRLFDPEDLVRIELECAIEMGIFIIPILMDSAKMPLYSELPVSIGQVAYRNALRFGAQTDIRPQIERIITQIQEFRKPQRTIRLLKVWLAGACLVAIALASATLKLWQEKLHRETERGFREELASRDPEIFGGIADDPTVLVGRAFANRLTLDKSRALKDQISEAQQGFYIFVLSGKSLNDCESSITEAIARGVAVRILLVDHSKENEAHLRQYLEIIPQSGRGDLPWYNADYESTLGILRRIDTGGQKGSLEFRLFRGPFINSFWVRDWDLPASVAGHIAVTTYGDDRNFPSLRVGRLGQPLAAKLKQQFDAMWQVSVEAPSAPP